MSQAAYGINLLRSYPPNVNAMKTPFLCLLLLLLSCRPVNQNSTESDSADGATVSEINTELESPLETIHFQILINASPEIVYNTMIDPEHFKTWTATFQPTSHFEGDWKQGSTIHFLSLDEAGNKMGLISKIKENVPNQRITLEHFGLIQEGQEITEGEEVEAIKGATEQYTFVSKDGQTELIVKTEVFIELKDYFDETWPKALQTLKQLCENQAT